LFVLSLIESAAFGQRGGKAGPLRIQFKRGASSATLNNWVSGDGDK
jgi:hypothetical protein